MMGDLPDFDSMSEEEQMRWLESLAKRQGGDERGFTTGADLEVPEMDPNTVVDEPGYTPYYSSSSGSTSQKPPSTPPAEPPPPAPEPMAEASMASGGDGDMSGIGDDPMAWLESLAKRQGGDERGFTTSADMDIAEIDPDSVVIDEPGYTPYGQAPAQPVAQRAPEPPVEEPIIEEPPAPARSSQPMLADGELPADIDPIKWLESLARRSPDVDARGLTNDEFYDIPEIDPASVVIDEPGYTPSSATSTTGGTQAKQPEPEVFDETELVDFDELEADDGVGEDNWLTDLATESVGDNVDDFLSAMTDDSLFALDSDDDFTFKEEAPAAKMVDSIVGMTDEEIARAQAEGTITPAQELAWLQQKLTEVPDEEDFDIADLAPQDIEDAIETDVPDWLAAQMPRGDVDIEVTGATMQDDMMSLVGQSEELDLDDLDIGDDFGDFDLDADLDLLDEDDALLGEIEMPAELLAEVAGDSPVEASTFAPD